MNKKVAIGVVVAAIAIASVIVGIKTTMGDKALGLPGEENTENALHVQESGESPASNSSTAASGESGSAESGESGP